MTPASEILKLEWPMDGFSKMTTTSFGTYVKWCRDAYLGIHFRMREAGHSGTKLDLAAKHAALALEYLYDMGLPLVERSPNYRETPTCLDPDYETMRALMDRPSRATELHRRLQDE